MIEVIHNTIKVKATEMKHLGKLIKNAKYFTDIIQLVILDVP